MPDVTPVTLPDKDHIVMFALLALHTPPEAVLLYVTGIPVHNVAGPVVIPATGLTVMFCVCETKPNV